MANTIRTQRYIQSRKSAPIAIPRTENPNEALDILDKLREAMQSLGVRRLSAPEIGINLQIFCVSDGTELWQVLNPVIDSVRPYGNGRCAEGSYQHVWLWGDKGRIVGHPEQNQCQPRIADARFACRDDYPDKVNSKFTFGAFLFYRDLFDGKVEFDVYKKVDGKAEKIGRNSPCPCGSGKKYKKCCGR